MDGMSVNGIASGRSLSEHKNPNLLLLDKHNSSNLEKKGPHPYVWTFNAAICH